MSGVLKLISSEMEVDEVNAVDVVQEVVASRELPRAYGRSERRASREQRGRRR